MMSYKNSFMSNKIKARGKFCWPVIKNFYQFKAMTPQLENRDAIRWEEKLSFNNSPIEIIPRTHSGHETWDNYTLGSAHTAASSFVKPYLIIKMENNIFSLWFDFSCDTWPSELRNRIELSFDSHIDIWGWKIKLCNCNLPFIGCNLLIECHKEIPFKVTERFI